MTATDVRPVTLRCVDDYRMFQFGERITGRRPGSISEDDLNYYWHDVNDDNGYALSNYLTLPKYAFVKEAQA